MRKNLREKLIPGVMGIVAIMLASCAGDDTTLELIPTPTTIPTFQFVQPTTPPQIATAAATNIGSENQPADVALERGRERYIALECNSCHGENGEGTELGSSLTGLTLSEDQFIDFLRTGGTLGNEHQYSTDRLSDRGSRNLYRYLQSLNPTGESSTNRTPQRLTPDPGLIDNLTRLPRATPLSGEEANVFLNLQQRIETCPDYTPERLSQMKQHIEWLIDPAQIPRDVIGALGTNPIGRLIYGMGAYTSIQWRINGRSPDSCLVQIGSILNDMLIATGERPFTVYDEIPVPTLP